MQRKIAEHFVHKKRLGQNFLKDKEIINEIIMSADIKEEDTVIEIGPGSGALTEKLVNKAGYLIAVELDERLINPLKLKIESLKKSDKFFLLNKDIMKADIPEILEAAERSCDKVRVIGNLPYYITTPILLKLLEKQNRKHIKDIIVMVQKEVADRIVAEKSTKAYGAITVKTRYHAEVERLIEVPGKAFFPKPKVDSTVVRLNLRERPAISVSDEEAYFKVVRKAFNQRRKTIKNSLSNIFDISDEQLINALKRANIEQRRRAETLDLEEFADLTEGILIESKNKNHFNS